MPVLYRDSPISDFGVCGQVGFEVSGLGESFSASFNGAEVWSITRVNAVVGSQIEIQGKPFSATLKNKC